MRVRFLALFLALSASPAVAQPAPAGSIAIPPQLTDPAMTDRLAEMMEAMSKAFLDMPVGEVQAAAEGRKPTAADRRRTIRSETRMSERELRQQIDQAKPAMQAGMKAMAAALPAMMKGMSEAAREFEKATSNLPSPNYPKR